MGVKVGFSPAASLRCIYSSDFRSKIVAVVMHGRRCLLKIPVAVDAFPFVLV